MKLRLCAFALVFVLLAGCGVSGQNPPAATALRFREPETREYLLAVDRNAPESLKNAAKSFCDYVSNTTDGLVTFSISETTDALTGASGGSAHLAFVPGQKLLDGNALSAVVAPFAYRGYAQFTMSANSAELLSVLSETVAEQYRIKALAGFYMGASCLFSTVPLEDAAAFRELLTTAQPGGVVLLPNSKLQAGFASLGFAPTAEVSYETRFRLLSEGEAVISEFSASELSFAGSFVDDSFYFIKSTHSIGMQFLVANSEFWSSLSDTSRAVVAEGLSRLFPLVDENTLLRESMLELDLSQRNVKSIAFPEAVRQACFSAWMQEREPDPLHDYITGLIGGVNPVLS